MATTEDELVLAFQEVGTQLKGKVTGLNGVTGIWKGTAAAYAAIATKDPNVTYIVVN